MKAQFTSQIPATARRVTVDIWSDTSARMVAEAAMNLIPVISDNYDDRRDLNRVVARACMDAGVPGRLQNTTHEIALLLWWGFEVALNLSARESRKHTHILIGD